MTLISSLTTLPPWVAFIRLSIPIILAQFLYVSSTIVDTIMAGQYGAIDLAGVAIGGSIMFPVMIFFVGIIIATTPSVAQAFGAKKQACIGKLVQQSLWLGLILSVLAVAFLHAMPALFSYWTIEVQLKRISLDYIIAVSYSLPAFIFMQSLRSFSEGINITKPMMYFGLLSVMVNIPMNYALIYGKVGFPEMGGVGCGWATSISAWVALIGMSIYCYAKSIYHECGFFLQLYMPDWQAILQLGKVGVPIAISIFIEATMFAIIALFLASEGPTVVASHQLVLSFSSFTFMIPLSIGMALTIRVGQTYGAQDTFSTKQASMMGFCLVLFAAVLICLVMILMPKLIARMYTQDKQVIQLAAGLFFFSALFQFSDALQVAAVGILRGFKDTRWPMLIVLFAYWAIGLPLGYALALTDLLMPASGAKGFWIGLIVGLSFAAVLLCSRVWRVLYKQQKLQQIKELG